MGVRIKKEKIPVFIMTERYRIEGEIHVVIGGRLIDEINRERDFIPITDVTIYDVGKDNRVDAIDFMAISKSAIVFLAPMRAVDVLSLIHI